MKQLSATDVARRFAEVLDSVESEHESFVVIRRGRAVATISPAPGASGQVLKEALRAHPADPEWAAELRELRDAIGPGTDAWRD